MVPLTSMQFSHLKAFSTFQNSIMIFFFTLKGIKHRPMFKLHVMDEASFRGSVMIGLSRTPKEISETQLG